VLLDLPEKLCARRHSDLKLLKPEGNYFIKCSEMAAGSGCENR
jgi:hypothetical protein